jgi:predicted nuclease of predicted toxin-antitoxin system
MRLCADENLPGDCVAALRAAGHDVRWIRETMPGATDDAVLACARREKRLLLTFDKDFGALVFQKNRRHPAGIVLFRLSLPSPAETAASVSRILESRQDWTGHFSVVDDTSIRMRPFPR